MAGVDLEAVLCKRISINWKFSEDEQETQRKIKFIEHFAQCCKDYLNNQITADYFGSMFDMDEYKGLEFMLPLFSRVLDEIKQHTIAPEVEVFFTGIIDYNHDVFLQRIDEIKKIISSRLVSRIKVIW